MPDLGIMNGESDRSWKPVAVTGAAAVVQWDWYPSGATRLGEGERDRDRRMCS